MVNFVKSMIAVLGVSTLPGATAINLGSLGVIAWCQDGDQTTPNQSPQVSEAEQNDQTTGFQNAEAASFVQRDDPYPGLQAAIQAMKNDLQYQCQGITVTDHTVTMEIDFGTNGSANQNTMITIMEKLQGFARVHARHNQMVLEFKNAIPVSAIEASFKAVFPVQFQVAV